MKIEELAHYRRVVLLGYGVEGRATERFFKTHFPTTKLIIADRNEGPDYLVKQNDADLVVRSPGVKLSEVTKISTTATNIFFANCPGTTIGVTGTKGKSTTASLITAMLRQKYTDVRLVGNIGTPMLDALDGATSETYFVIELSSYQLADCLYAPHIALVVNWYPEHLDFHGSFEAYKKAKQSIITHQQSGDLFVYDPHEEEVKRWLSLTKAQLIPYLACQFSTDMPNPLIGAHNMRNICGAYTVAHLCGVGLADCGRALASFKPLSHRLQFVGKYRDIYFYDDAISTTPQSTIAAIRSIPRINTILLGGLDRGYDFYSLAHELATHHIRHLILFPTTGARIRQEVEKIEGYLPELFETSSMKEAVEHAFAVSEKGTTCVLSTASPSYSLWKNFEEKGDLFQQFVKQCAAL